MTFLALFPSSLYIFGVSEVKKCLNTRFNFWQNVLRIDNYVYILMRRDSFVAPLLMSSAILFTAKNLSKY